MRMNNIIDNVRRASQNRRPPANPVLKELVERPTPVLSEELIAALVKEVVLNARDFLSVEFLERGTLTARSVGRILIRTGGGPRARGTGFLVGPELVLTNEHVLPEEGLAAACAIEMDYEHNLLGPAKQPQTFLLDPKRFFIVDAKLDFALVGAADHSDRGAPSCPSPTTRSRFGATAASRPARSASFSNKATSSRTFPRKPSISGRFAIRQKRIGQIERSLDISFGPVSEWDVLADTRAEEALDDEGILINTASDMRLNGRRRVPGG